MVPTTVTNEEGESFDRPYVLTIDDFLTNEEADRLIELGRMEGYQTSALYDPDEDDGEEPTRQSSNSWCSSPACTDDPITRSVLQRMYDLVQIPQEYSEFIQLLYYQPGQ
jgi:prolyl 4-hydroxylase